jgi:hypothetical protein
VDGAQKRRLDGAVWRGPEQPARQQSAFVAFAATAVASPWRCSCSFAPSSCPSTTISADPAALSASCCSLSVARLPGLPGLPETSLTYGSRSESIAPELLHVCVVKKVHAASGEERGKGGGDSHQVWVTAALASGVSSSIRGESDRNGMSMPSSFLGARHAMITFSCSLAGSR